MCVAHEIHFDGDWTPRERRLLEQAIADAEYFASSHFEQIGKPWICYCKRLAERTVYMAHRTGWSRVFYAYGAAELSLKIVMFGESPTNPRAFDAEC